MPTRGTRGRKSSIQGEEELNPSCLPFSFVTFNHDKSTLSEPFGSQMADSKDPSTAVPSSSIAPEPVQEERAEAAPSPSGGKRALDFLKKAFDFCVEQW